MRSRLERHHELFDRKTWSSRPELAALRGDAQLIVPLEHDVHRELHANITYVPSLSLYVARAALGAFGEYGHTPDHLLATERLQAAIEEAVTHPKTDRIEREVGLLAVHALDLQKPYIKESRRLSAK